jgi:calcineurin-like phosphoesterase family protein
MKIITVISLTYKDIFDDYESVDIKNILETIPSKSALEIIGHFSAQIHTKERDNDRQIEFIKIWLGRLPMAVHKKAI